MSTALDRGRTPASAALTIVAVLWTGLFLWRKTFSYLDVFGVYIIEVAALAALGVFACYVALRPSLSFAIPREPALQLPLTLCAAFVGYSMLRAVFSDRVSAIGMIPGVYPSYLLLVAIVAVNCSTTALRRTAAVFAGLFFLAPLVGHLNAMLAGYIGPVESPGWTYVYGVSLAMSLVLVRRPVVSTLLFGIYFIYALFMFQRGVFVALALAWLAVAVAARRADSGILVRAAFVRGGAMALAAILAAPLLFQIMFGGQFGRFLVTPGNIVDFLLSIVGMETELAGGVGGTRAHRLDMWRQITSLVYASLPSSLFGFGYGGEVGEAVGISFRAPHNGFVTILYRSGTIGVVLYTGLLLSLFRYFARALRQAGVRTPVGWHASIGLIILGAMVGDALAGTILDSPFTSMMFYAHAAVTAVVVGRYRALEGARYRPVRQAPGTAVPVG
jgi:hypothetical protein